jgi:paraquat-inducible protein B
MKTGEALLGVSILIAACSEDPQKAADENSPVLFVLFDERHHLEGGEAVRLHDFEIGEVTNVELSQARVRAEIRLDPEVFPQLTEQTTFSVENEDSAGRYLETYVLDPDAPPLRAGATLEGVDSVLELTVRRAGASIWFKSAMELVEEMKRELEQIDWNEGEQALREQWEEASKELEKLSEQSKEEAKKSYDKAAAQVKKLIERLDELGHSEEAQNLRERLEKLKRDLGLEDHSG